MSSAVGSLSEELRPLDMVLPDQFIAPNKLRDTTIFGAAAAVHRPHGPAVGAGDPAGGHGA